MAPINRPIDKLDFVRAHHIESVKLLRRQMQVENTTGAVVPQGTVLAKITAAGAAFGEVHPWDPGASNGLESPIHILAEEIDAATTTQFSHVCVGYSDVKETDIVFGTATAAQIALCKHQLEINSKIFMA